MAQSSTITKINLPYTDCAQIFKNGNMQSGFYMIKPLLSPTLIRVYCDMTEGGGWTVFQRRSDGNQSFDRYGKVHCCDCEKRCAFKKIKHDFYFFLEIGMITKQDLVT